MSEGAVLCYVNEPWAYFTTLPEFCRLIEVGDGKVYLGKTS